MAVSSELKKGQFLWMPPKSKQRYLEKLKKRIDRGYYSSEKVISAVIEKLAPAFDSEIDRSL